jgi:sec-independent protein translocase protein TatC
MGVKIVFTKLLEPLMLRLQMSFVMGLVVSLPFVFYFLWSFISPGLYNHEKRWIMPLIFVSTGCFFLGSALAWFLIIPFMLKFMQNFNLPGTEGMLTIGPFVSLLLKLTMAFGVIFEMPVVSFILAKIGILKYKLMTKYRKYAIVVAFIIAAIITPTVDPVTQTVTAIPLYVLYEISIFVAMIAGKKTLL